jgi:PEGA domain
MIRKILVLIFISILLAGCITGQPAEKSTLQLTSSPTGAEIYLDNQYKGSTPGTIAGIEPGSHILEFRMSGYKSWKAVVTVQPGVSDYSATLTAQPDLQQSEDINPVTTAVPAAVTVQASRDRMVVGDTNLFFGTATGTSSVALTLYGPGYYKNGIALADQIKPNAANAWSYTWNPGTRIQSGTYTIVVENLGKTVSSRATFTAIGDGVVSVIPSNYAIATGEAFTLSGRCTTGAPNVRVVLFGPERFASGVDLGSFPVMADQTWSMRYTTDLTMPPGVYSVYVSDVPQTATGSSQFTIGFAS